MSISARPVIRAALLAAAVLAAACATLRTRTAVVALGDSTTAGAPYFRSPVDWPPKGAGNPAGQYVYWMKKERPAWELLNRGAAGEKTAGLRARFVHDVIEAKPRFVVILAGLEDIRAAVAPKRTHANLLWMYRTARAAGIKALAASVLPVNMSTPEQKRALRALNAWIAETAADEDILFCDLNKAARDPKDWDKLKGSSDGMHPDIPTYTAVARAVTACLDQG